MVGLDRLELSTSPLSGVRSNHLSYRPGPGRSLAWRGKPQKGRKPQKCPKGRKRNEGGVVPQTRSAEAASYLFQVTCRSNRQNRINH